MLTYRYTLMLILLLLFAIVGCRETRETSGTFTVENDIVVESTDAAFAAYVGGEAPAGFFRPPPTTTYAGLRLELWRGACTGTGRETHCAGGLNLFAPTQPATPRYRINTRHAASGFHQVGAYLYLSWTHSDSLGAMGRGGTTIEVYTLDAAAGPQLQATYPVTGGRVTARRLSDDMLLLGTVRGVELVDIRNPAAPTFISLSAVDDARFDYGFIHDMLLIGDTLYIDWQLGRPCGMYVGTACQRYIVTFDITDRTAPREIDRFSVPEKVPSDLRPALAVRDDALFVPLGEQSFGQEIWTIYPIK